MLAMWAVGAGVSKRAPSQASVKLSERPNP
jgi:hypothetical protein